MTERRCEQCKHARNIRWRPHPDGAFIEVKCVAEDVPDLVRDEDGTTGNRAAEHCGRFEPAK